MLSFRNKMIGLVASLFLLVSVASGESLKIDKSHSEVAFSIKHMMISNVKGNFNSYDGNIDFDIKAKKFNTLKATIFAKSIDTGIEKRDNHLRSADFFEVDKYPEITFVMTSYTANGDSGIMEGDITIHGVTKKITLGVDVNGVIKDFQGNTRAGFTFTGKLNRKDFGLTWNKALEFGGFAVGEEVKLTIELETVVK